MIYRIVDPDLVINFVPWFVPTEQNPFDIGMDMHRMLTTEPEKILILADVDEQDCCHAFVAAVLEDDCAHIWQARSDSKCRSQITVLDVLCRWAKRNNRTTLKLRAEQGPLHRLYRRYGFTPS